MLGAPEIYSKLGSGFCLVKEGKISESYLLSDSEIERIKKISPLTVFFPEDFEIGILELDIESRYAFIRLKDGFLLFPVRTENIGEIVKKKGVIYET